MLTWKRPQLCKKKCVDNYFNVCQYKKGQMVQAFTVKDCPHFEPIIEEAKPLPKVTYWDYIWSNFCDYRDSHSARYVR